jgi:hypothetical protein
MIVGRSGYPRAVVLKFKKHQRLSPFDLSVLSDGEMIENLVGLTIFIRPEGLVTADATLTEGHVQNGELRTYYESWIVDRIEVGE